MQFLLNSPQAEFKGTNISTKYEIQEIFLLAEMVKSVYTLKLKYLSYYFFKPILTCVALYIWQKIIYFENADMDHPPSEYKS